jgi:hypothetical protein
MKRESFYLSRFKYIRIINSNINFIVIAFFIFINSELFAQVASPCPIIYVGNDTTLFSCVNGIVLNANVVGIPSATSYVANSVPYAPLPKTGNQVFIGLDDLWSDTIDLPFKFCFFDTTYTKFVIGSNGLISFNVARANFGNVWNFASINPFPNNTFIDAFNSIMCPYHDIDPSIGGFTRWQVQGSPPCRKMVISWDSIPLYSCTTIYATHQIVLYEGTSVIETFIENKPTCSSWNTGQAAHGIQNSTGTVAVMVPGRNLPTNWTAQNDGYRWTPTGPTNLVTIKWFKINGTYIGSGTSLFVNPQSNTTYYAQATYHTCSDDSIILYDTIKVNVKGIQSNVFNFKPISCYNANDGSFDYFIKSIYPPTTCYLNGVVMPYDTLYHFLNIGGPDTFRFYGIDSLGCEIWDTIIFANPSLLDPKVPVHNNVTCFGQANGSINYTITGGTAPYTVTLNNIPIINSPITGLIADTFLL